LTPYSGMLEFWNAGMQEWSGLVHERSIAVHVLQIWCENSPDCRYLEDISTDHSERTAIR
jgi:hypothetical protein